MPMLKEPKAKQPLWKENDYKAQKKGIRHTVYSVNGDQYTGEWLNNLKDGMLNLVSFTYDFLLILNANLIHIRILSVNRIEIRLVIGLTLFKILFKSKIYISSHFFII